MAYGSVPQNRPERQFLLESAGLAVAASMCLGKMLLHYTFTREKKNRMPGTRMEESKMFWKTKKCKSSPDALALPDMENCSVSFVDVCSVASILRLNKRKNLGSCIGSSKPADSLWGREAVLQVQEEPVAVIFCLHAVCHSLWSRSFQIFTSREVLYVSFGKHKAVW